MSDGSMWAGVLDRPASTPLAVAVIALAAGAALHWWAAWSTRPPRPEPGPPSRPPALEHGAERRVESAAVVALLTSGFDVPAAAIPATVLDLAARGWLRLAHADGELVVVTKGAGAAAGDVVRAHEQLVLNHLSARAFNDAVSGATLAVAQRRLTRRWRRRFCVAAARTARELGLTTPRYTLVQIAPTAASGLLAAYALWRAARGGSDVAVADSWLSRLIWFAAVGALVTLAWKTVDRALGSASRPTVLGLERACRWLGYRARLAERIPPNASVVGAPDQQDALGRAVAMGLSRQVYHELPISREDPHHGWSEAGGIPHTVRVSYPVIPGYGQHPVRVLIAGIVGFAVALWLRHYLGRIANGDALVDLLDKAPGRIDLFHDLARWLSILCWIPIVASAWCILAGAVDTVVTRQRTGMVVRTRQPFEVLPRPLVPIVKPFGERTGFSTYLAVDDGRHQRVLAWLASERSAAPQGAQARVRATPLLGYVRSSEPIGTATRPGV